MYIHTRQVQTIADHYINHAQCIYQKLKSSSTADESTHTTQRTQHIASHISPCASYASYRKHIHHSLEHFNSYLHHYARVHHNIGAHLQETITQLHNYDAALARNFSSE